MIYTDFSMKKDGFVGHMVEPEGKNIGHRYSKVSISHAVSTLRDGGFL